MPEPEMTLAEKLASASEAPKSPSSKHEDEYDTREYEAFVICRGQSRRAETLNLSFKNGQQEALAYSHFYRARMETPSDMVVEFSDHEVRISGLRLMEGYRRILGHRVLQVSEADTPTAQLTMPTDRPLVTSIEVKRRERLEVD